VIIARRIQYPTMRGWFIPNLPREAILNPDQYLDFRATPSPLYTRWMMEVAFVAPSVKSRSGYRASKVQAITAENSRGVVGIFCRELGD